MAKNYKHLTTLERAVVMTMRDDQCSIRSIAKRLCRSASAGITIKVSERFESPKAHSFLGAHLGKTATQMRVPVVYRYHIELAPEWKIRTSSRPPLVRITTGSSAESRC